jgi:hypothetical protein
VPRSSPMIYLFKSVGCLRVCFAFLIVVDDDVCLSLTVVFLMLVCVEIDDVTVNL